MIALAWKLLLDDFRKQAIMAEFSLGVTFQTILNIINIVVAGIAAISLLIGTVGVANTMFTSVVERTKQIGIMKSVGAKNQAILIIFIIEAALLGLIGG